MATIDKAKPVLVTGGTGYVASWIIKILLEERINVNATVRDPSDVQKVEHLVALAKASPGKLKLFIHSSETGSQITVLAHRPNLGYTRNT